MDTFKLKLCYCLISVLAFLWRKPFSNQFFSNEQLSPSVSLMLGKYIYQANKDAYTGQSKIESFFGFLLLAERKNFDLSAAVLIVVFQT